jgi:hypothetical protein
MRAKTLVGAGFVAVYVVACSSAETTSESQINGQSVAECDVAIVGGGAGGIHTAYRLAGGLGSKVCLFEKEKELGGRIRDISFDDDVADPNAPRVGVGARRVMETQEVLFALATELGLELEKPPNQADLINARKIFSFSKDDIAEKAYPTIPKPTNADKDRETFIYDLLRASPERATLPSPKYPDFVSYIKQVAGEEQYNFLRDMSRFRADFEYPLDARGYLDYLDEEWDVCCQPQYPKGGMSSFIRGMETRSAQAGARIFKDEPVTSIYKRDGGYELKTPRRTVHANRIVINAPPSAVSKMTGDVPDRIKNQPQFLQIIGVKVVTVTQFWADSWWNEIKNPAVTENANVWRSWTTEHCLNFVEIPVEPYAAAQKVTRSVYVDNLKCADYWENLSKQGPERVEEELQKGLTALFNNAGVSSPATLAVPKPKKTVVQVWPAAWYWLKAGATITNAQLADWAVEPLAGEPVALVGEAYNVQRSGWSDAAYKSSIKLLNAKYGMTLAGVKPKSTPMASLGPRSVQGGLSGH